MLQHNDDLFIDETEVTQPRASTRDAKQQPKAKKVLLKLALRKLVNVCTKNIRNYGKGNEQLCEG